MSESSKQFVRRYVDEVYTKGNTDNIDEFLSPDYVNHTEMQEIEGLEAVREFVATMHTAMPDMTEVIHDQVSQGDYEVHRWTISGTHEGEWMGIPPSNNPVSLSGLTLARFEDGKIAEEWSYTNTLALMMQIGAIPADALGG